MASRSMRYSDLSQFNPIGACFKHPICDNLPHHCTALIFSLRSRTYRNTTHFFYPFLPGTLSDQHHVHTYRAHPLIAWSNKKIHIVCVCISSVKQHVFHICRHFSVYLSCYNVVAFIIMNSKPCLVKSTKFSFFSQKSCILRCKGVDRLENRFQL